MTRMAEMITKLEEAINKINEILNIATNIKSSEMQLIRDNEFTKEYKFEYGTIEMNDDYKIVRASYDKFGIDIMMHKVIDSDWNVSITIWKHRLVIGGKPRHHVRFSKREMKYLNEIGYDDNHFITKIRAL